MCTRARVYQICRYALSIGARELFARLARSGVRTAHTLHQTLPLVGAILTIVMTIAIVHAEYTPSIVAQEIAGRAWT